MKQFSDSIIIFDYLELSCYSCSTFVGIGLSSVDINMGGFCFEILWYEFASMEE